MGGVVVPATILGFMSLSFDDFVEEYEDSYQCLLNNKKVTWTVKSTTKRGDKVFFFCSATSNDRLGIVIKKLERQGYTELAAYVSNEIRPNYKRNHGKIVATGIAETDAEYDSTRGCYFSDIKDLVVLEMPLAYREFKEIQKISQYGAVTSL